MAVRQGQDPPRSEGKLSYDIHCGGHCGLDWRGREYHYHGGTQASRRRGRQMSRYYRRRDPWDLMPRDLQLDLQYTERSQLRAAEREALQPSRWPLHEED